MASNTDRQLLTVAETADRLEMTTDGVYKLIQRGKLDAVRLSARKTRVSAQSLDRYMNASQVWVDRYLSAQPRIDVQTLRDTFIAEAGMSPESWLTAWKRDQFDDTHENMIMLARAAALCGQISETKQDEIKVRATAPAGHRK